ncbi:ATP-binding protein [Marichromatium gracile]|uniref:histidine kinase n=1 Tax=Marichromatium gracile TaxID=1048 RepID=A0A4R4AK48_MARGR|nr:ATP-binding protein [Marichromatium gracile]MBK1707794.1 hybrid sensor histidine kinase/response regulator [Marichromatium gracile]MBO8086689.1 response regulator [Marichromatium sp.]TCW39783.1 signal transduction histidine kinase [Marichromatium gracile]
MKLRLYILLFLLAFGVIPLMLAVAINLPLVLDRTALFYQRAYLQNLRADFRDLDQHLASRHEMIRLLARLPEPELILGLQGEPGQVALARERYTRWVNQILVDQRDIIQILFVDGSGALRFQLARDRQDHEWRATERPPLLPEPRFLDTGLSLQPGAVLVSRIRIDQEAGARDQRQLMTLSLISRLGDEGGAVVMAIDVGGLAQFYRDTLWVNHDGSYLRPGQPGGASGEAFVDFSGLEAIFTAGNLALWKDRAGRQLLWVPMFLTEDGAPLWVGRAVDPSPIDAFRDALMVRVLSIMLALVVVVMVVARLIARRLERFGQSLTRGLTQVLREGRALRFHWRGPREIRALGAQLTALAQTHAEHLRAEQAQTRELERSNRYKSEFLANVSHELRTPLNSILLLSKMLAAESGGLDPAQRRQAQVIHAAGRDLRAMIDNILDISRIEAGQVDLDLDRVELPPLLESLVALIEPQLADKPVRLSLEIDPRAPRQIHCDGDKLRQILKNFLSNALKFTERGHILLGCAPSDDPELPLALSVADTGIGIAEDKQGLIFEAFQQADGSTRRRYGGTGLGLSISRELAALLGGRISVESAPGAGARFTLLLPLTAPGGAPDASPATAVPPATTPDTVAPVAVTETASPEDGDEWVLVIAREVPLLVRLAAALGRRGLRVQTAADLEEAGETLDEEGEGCMLVLLALTGAPGESCDSIHGLIAQCRGAAPAVVLLGEAEASPPGPCREAGVLALLAKSVDDDRLDRLLAEVRGARAPSTRDAHQAGRAATGSGDAARGER